MRNGKRTLSLLLLALLVALLLPGAAHADPPKGDTHLHSWSVTSEKKATCTEAGSKTWKCSLCGQTYTETYPALGHSFDSGKITTQPTCTEYGVRTYTCSRCGEKKTSAIRPTGHTPAILPAEDPTCVDPGLTEGTVCEICNEILTPQEAIPATGHSWSDWALLTEATCTEGGTEIRSCLSCGAEETRPTDALGHAPAAIPGTAPTCEADGLTEGEVCSRCGAVLKAQQALPATGHSWDEGQVTREPSGFTPGVRTFTCKNDPGHTRTEEIDPAPWLFATFTGSIPDFATFEASTHDLTPLTITEHPQDGAVTRHGGDSLTLHVAATGGTGDYTYEWKYRTNANSNIGNIISWLNLKTSGKQTEPVFEAYDGNMRYWCVVTDSAGNTAQSETAIVSYKLGIAKQPDNANLQPTGKATLSCLAEDGSGSYSYRWIDNQDNEIDVGSSIDVTEIGDYLCIATDDVTGEEAHSYVATVYDTEPFTLVYFTGDAEYVPEGEGSGILMAEFKGGVQPYEIWWDKDGEAHESQEGDMNENYGSVVHITTLGDYTVHAVDAMGEVITATSHLTAPKLTIVEQPVGGTIPKGSYTRINVVVADGEMPYTYILYQNGKEYLTETDDDDSCPVCIWDPGEYYYHIEDSKGRQVDSDAVIFEDAVFRIKKQTEWVDMTDDDRSAVLSVEVEGGKEPYTYTWTIRKNGYGYKVGNDEAVYRATEPGEYSCRIKDALGDTIRSKNITVAYAGSVPWIIEQPIKGGTLTIVEGELRYFNLSCKAISGFGDGSNLRYDWYRDDSLYAADTQSCPAYFAGKYRCKVTDTLTGRSAYSTIAVIYDGFRNISFDISETRDSYRARISFKGGTAPYKVIVYQKYPTPDGIKDVYYRSYTISSLDELATKSFTLPRKIEYLGSRDNGYEIRVAYAEYYFIIIDALGQKVESKTIGGF